MLTAPADLKAKSQDPFANTGTVSIVSKNKKRADGKLHIDMVVDLSDLNVKKSKAVEVIPVLQNGADTLTLPKMWVTGRVRHLIFERMSKKERAGIHEVRRENNTQQTADYSASIEYKSWMRNAELFLITDLCGCGWSLESKENRIPVDKFDFAELQDYVPALACVAPKPERKERSITGKAFLDFPVDKIEIYPNYRNNPRELLKIQATIDSVRHNQFATITDVTIKGFASPEASYEHNTYLSKNRAQALIAYVKGLYHFKDVKFNVEYEPEDWAGLDSMVSKSNMAEKQEILEIIRSDKYINNDAREWALKTLGDGSAYRFMLASFYPALRHSDYTVTYEIRAVSDKEAEQLVRTNPSLLSVEEMYRVAKKYPKGSKEYNEIIEIAAKTYPSDPVANINAANNDILNGNLKSALRKLVFVPDSWGEKMLAEGAIALLEGDTAAAREMFRKAKAAGMKEADENLDFINRLEQ